MNTEPQRNRRRSVGLAAAGVAAAGMLAAAGVAYAATSPETPTASDSTTSSDDATTPDTTTTPDSTTTQGRGPGGHGRAFDHGGSTPVRSDENSVSTDQAEQLTAAALEAVPGATVYRVETDAGDAAYEAHLEKSDGTLATVKFDESLNVIEVQDGMGMGDPAPQGGNAPDASADGTTA